MANREGFVAGLGLAINGQSSLAASLANGSMTWIPAFVTTQSNWTTGTNYTASSDTACGSQVFGVSSAHSFVCVVKGGSTSTVDPSASVTTAGTLTAVLSDGYQWLCLGNNTADFTSLANANQAVSQIIFDNRPSASEGDTIVEVSISLATGSSGAAGDYIGILTQWLNQDGTTYGDGLGGGSNLSSSVYSLGSIAYSAGKTSPIVGSISAPLRAGRFRPALINSSGNTLSASTHVVAIRTMVYGLNQ